MAVVRKTFVGALAGAVLGSVLAVGICGLVQRIAGPPVSWDHWASDNGGRGGPESDRSPDPPTVLILVAAAVGATIGAVVLVRENP